MGAFDNIKNALGLTKKKKNTTQVYFDRNENLQNSHSRRNQTDRIANSAVPKRDADDEKTTMIWTPRDHK